MNSKVNLSKIIFINSLTLIKVADDVMKLHLILTQMFNLLLRRKCRSKWNDFQIIIFSQNIGPVSHYLDVHFPSETKYLILRVGVPL